VTDLSPLDVSARRREQLRQRCHAQLSAQARATEEASVWRRVVGPVAAAAWSAMYVFQMVRLALAFYRL
jgi:hypothetical protein